LINTLKLRLCSFTQIKLSFIRQIKTCERIWYSNSTC